MTTAIQARAAVSSKPLWASRIMRTIVVLFLLTDAGMHLATPAPVVQAMNQLGYPLDVTVTIGVIELVLTVLSSLKSTIEQAAVPPTYFTHALSLDSYAKLWSYQDGLPTYLFNSAATARGRPKEPRRRPVPVEKC